MQITHDSFPERSCHMEENLYRKKHLIKLMSERELASLKEAEILRTKGNNKPPLLAGTDATSHLVWPQESLKRLNQLPL